MVRLRNLSPLSVVEIAAHSEFNETAGCGCIKCSQSFTSSLSRHVNHVICFNGAAIRWEYSSLHRMHELVIHYFSSYWGLGLGLALVKSLPHLSATSQNNYMIISRSMTEPNKAMSWIPHHFMQRRRRWCLHFSFIAISFIQHRLHKHSKLAANQPFHYAGCPTIW